MAIALLIGVVAVLIIGYVVLTYNKLVALRLGVDNSWAQVDVALKQRHDLVPNLAAAVSGYANHERGTLEAVTEARQQAVAAPSDSAGVDLGKAEANLAQRISALLAVAEAYPDLKASTNFLELQRQLAEIESQIQITRRVYNDVVETYLTKTQSVPSNLVANAFGFEPREFFKAPIEASAVPAVGFGG